MIVRRSISGMRSALVAATFLSCPAAAQELDGRYVGNGENAQMEILVEGGSAVAVLRGHGCLGEVAGQLLVGEGGIWGIGFEESWGSCQLVMQPSAPLSYTVEQGQGCSSFHGASCGFRGFVRKVGP